MHTPASAVLFLYSLMLTSGLGLLMPAAIYRQTNASCPRSLSLPVNAPQLDQWFTKECREKQLHIEKKGTATGWEALSMQEVGPLKRVGPGKEGKRAGATGKSFSHFPKRVLVFSAL